MVETQGKRDGQTWALKRKAPYTVTHTVGQSGSEIEDAAGSKHQSEE